MMGYGVGILLLTAIGGYWVLERASEHKGELKRVGYALGSVIIAISLLGILCGLWCVGTGKTGSCPFGMGGKGWGGPRGAIAPSSAPATK